MIAVQLQGRMGNQMFQYATVRTIAEKKGYDFAVIASKDFSWRYSKLFDIDLGVKPVEMRQTFYDNHDVGYNPAIEDVDDFTLLYGYFQSDKFFDHDKTRHWFTPHVRLPVIDDNVCCIHFRGGDYNEFPWKNFQLPISYYTEAMVKMLSIRDDMKFIVVTDDLPVAKQHFPNIDVISHNHDKDFVMLMASRYVIISNSSYSWWAAWLNPNNTVIGPQGWFLYNSDKSKFSPAGIKVDRFMWI